jgi:hypothetical protein
MNEVIRWLNDLKLIDKQLVYKLIYMPVKEYLEISGLQYTFNMISFTLIKTVNL